MEVDLQLLKESVVFPLVGDVWGGYIWDSDGTMICQFESKNKDLSDSVTGDIIEAGCVSQTGDIALIDGDFYLYGEYLGCIRGWGTFQYEPSKNGKRGEYNPERGAKVQDNLALYILNVLNYCRNEKTS